MTPSKKSPLSGKVSKRLLIGGAALVALASGLIYAWYPAEREQAATEQAAAVPKARVRRVAAAQRPSPEELKRAQAEYEVALAKTPQDDWVKKRYSANVVIFNPPVPRDPEQQKASAPAEEDFEAVKGEGTDIPHKLPTDPVALRKVLQKDFQRRVDEYSAAATPEERENLEKQAELRHLAQKRGAEPVPLSDD